MRLTLVVCSYTIAPAELLLKLDKLSRRLAAPMGGVIVCNGSVDSIAYSHRHAIENWSLIKGSNRVHDFSAYAEGLKYLQDADECGDAVIFINDSLFQTHHAGQNMRALLRQVETLKSIGAPALSGKCDRYFTICHQNPWSGMGIYVSTYCFALNRAALTILHSLDEYATKDLGCTAVSVLDDTWGQGLAVNFRELLRCFLKYGSKDFSWKKKAEYMIDETLILSKARCIYSEHRLSGEIGRVGCILPTNHRKSEQIRFWVYEKSKQYLSKLWP